MIKTISNLMVAAVIVMLFFPPVSVVRAGNSDEKQSDETQEDYVDPRVSALAHNLIHYSVNLQKGEKILIEVCDNAVPLAKALIDEVYRVGGIPFFLMENSQLDRALYRGAGKEQFQLMAKWDSAQMYDVDACLLLEPSDNMNELSDVPLEKMNLYEQYYEKPVIYDVCVNETKWCFLRFPNPAMAQAANMSTESFENFFFNVCNMDYSKMDKAMDPLVELMKKTDRVHIVGTGTDLTFSIKGIPVIKCAGKLNIPDGEVFTAPVRNSVNGVITFDTPSLFMGTTYQNICLEFKDGKIVKATANYTEKINKVFDIDEGARYIGEFSLAVNPYIDKPMNDILFDEKIKGSFHFTPGNCYDMADNGNKSSIHWDLVNIQTQEYGGGEIWFDGKLIRKDGLFVLPELEGLNPENLK